jgi:hypothetical protein
MGKDQTNTYLIPYKGGTLECDRVTGVLGATKASAGLSDWYAREERAGIIRHIKAGGAVSEIENRTQVVEGKVVPWYFAEEIRDAKAHTGTVIHHLIHQHATGESLPADMVPTADEIRRFEMWKKLMVSEGIVYASSELRRYSSVLLVAGTLDLKVSWRGRLWILDTKTGRLKRDAAVQAATYTVLDAETSLFEAEDWPGLEKFQAAYKRGEVPQFEWPSLGVLHIEDDSVELYEIDPKLNEMLVRNFLYRLQIFRDDQQMRPFRRVWQADKVDKKGNVKPFEPSDKWLRAS